MIDLIKSKQKLGIDINSLQAQNAVKIIWNCDLCGVEKIKRYDEAIRGTGLCSSCHGKKIGKILGDTYGKAQKLTNKCLYCATLISSQLSSCQEHKQIHLSNIRSGSKNGSWKGAIHTICSCGSKKAHKAKRCRKCSFASGERNGSNNGRWEPDRGKIIAARVARGVLGNVMVLLDKKKAGKTVSILKYTFKDFRKHIEGQFEPWMNWENRGNKLGTWSIDHIIPVTVLIQNGITDPGIINALWNLRPLCAIKNIQRGNTVDNEVAELAQCKLNLTLTYISESIKT